MRKVVTVTFLMFQALDKEERLRRRQEIRDSGVVVPERRPSRRPTMTREQRAAAKQEAKGESDNEEEG